MPEPGRRRFRKRWVYVALVVVLAAPMTLYWRATRPAALQKKLTDIFRFIPEARVHAADLSFSLTSGLEVTGLSVSSGRAEGEMLRAERVLIHTDPWAVLFGKVRATLIEADGVTAVIARDARSGRLNWHVAPRGRAEDARPSIDDLMEPPTPGTVRALPQLRLRGVDLHLVRDEIGGRRLLHRTLFDVNGRLDEDQYHVVLTHPGSGQKSVGRLRWNLADRTARAELDWLPIETFGGLASPEASDWLARLGAVGRVRLAGLEFGRGGVKGATIEFSEIAAGLPVTDSESALRTPERYLQLSRAVGFVKIEGSSVRLAADGALNDGEVSVRLDTTLDAEEPARSGYAGNVELRGVSLPAFDVPRQNEFIRGLPQRLFNFFEDFRPESQVDAVIHLVRAPGQEEPEAEGRVKFLGGRCRYFRFPYQFDDVRGEVEFSARSVAVRQLTGRHGSARAVATAVLAHPHAWTAFDLTVDAVNVPLDRDMYAALNERDQRLWNETQPIGVCDLKVSIRRDEGSRESGPLPPHTRIDADLRAGSLSLGPKRRLTSAAGRVTIDGGVVTLHDLRGFVDDSPMSLEGQIHAATDEAGEAVDLRVTAESLPLEHATGAGDAMALRFEGVGDVWGDIHRSPAGDSDDCYVVRIRDGRLWSGRSGPVWSAAQGWASRRGDQLMLDSLQTRLGDAWMTVSGVLPAGGGDAAPLTLEFQAGDLHMESLSQFGLPGRWGAVCDELGLSGDGRLSVRLRPTGANGPPRQAGEVRLESRQMRPRVLPLDFRDVRGSVSVTDGVCEIEQATGRYGEHGKVRLVGKVGMESEPGWSEFTVSAEAVDIGRDFVAAMPGALRDLLLRLEPRGRADITLHRARFDGGPRMTWSVQGELKIAEGRLNAGLLLDPISGTLAGRAATDKDGVLGIDAQFAIQSGGLAGRPIERWEGRMIQAPGEPELHLKDVRGRMCGGEIVGEGAIDLTEKTYDISLTLQDVSFDRFVGRNTGKPGDAYEGRLDGHIFVRGRAGEESTRTGGGDLRIRGASLLRTPLVKNVVEQRKPGSVNEELDVAELRFAMEGSVLHLTRVDLASRDLRLVGQGDWDMDADTIEMTLVGAHPKHWPRVAILTDLIEIAGREFVQYRLSGPSSSPRVVAEPLHGLTEPIRRMLTAAP